MIFTLIGLVILLIKSLDFLYLFQTKEYRMDRILNFLKEEDFFNLSYRRLPRLPAKSARNMLIFFWIIFVLAILFLFLSSMPYALLFIILLIHPFIALIITISGIQITQLPVIIYRNNLIKKAAEKVKKSKAIFIGVTGSYGKTSTKEFLYQILSQKFKVAKTDKNYNSEVGIAISILKNLKSDTEYFVAELGAYRKGEIKAACDIIHPKYGILTGIGNQHLSLFGSKKNLIDAKSELLESLPKNGVAYVNKEIKEWKTLAEKTEAKVHFYSSKDFPAQFKTNLIGEHNIQNLTPCIALAKDLGLENSLIEKTISNLKPIKGRLSQETGLNGAIILDDSYNSNVDGFISAITTASRMNFSQKFILSRGMIELGEEKTSSYKKIVESLSKSDLSLLTTDNLFKTFDSENKIVTFQNENQLLDYIKERVDKDSLIVIEGRFEPKTLEVLRHSGK